MFRFKTFSLCTSRTVKVFSFFIVFFSFFSIAVKAQGNLLITPKRIVFENNKRSEDISLANTGKDSATYVVSFIQIRMNEDGSFEKIETPDPDQLFADPFLRIFPRQVTLAPNEAQTVKVQLKKTGDMKDGEYRSHLYFRAIPNEGPLGEKTLQKDSAVAVKLTPIFGISIPVIIRHGASNAQAQVSDVSLQLEKDKPPVAKLSFNRSGNMSMYGDVAVNYISNEGKVTKIGTAKGFAIYTPNTIRHFNLALDHTDGLDLHSGKLQVVYSDPSTKQPIVLAAKEIALQ